MNVLTYRHKQKKKKYRIRCTELGAYAINPDNLNQLLTTIHSNAVKKQKNESTFLQ